MEEVLSSKQLAAALVSQRQRMDAAEAAWLKLLAEFDRRGAWAADGHLCAVDWLVARCGMARSTAKERLRVAHELARRPLVRERFTTGEMSYSKVRAMTRITTADHDTDTALLQLAEAGTAADLEAAARHWAQIRDQDVPVAAARKAWEKRGVRRYRNYNGLDTVELVAPPEYIDRVFAMIDEYARSHGTVNKVSAECAKVPPDAVCTSGTVDKVSAESSWSQRRLDALLDLIEEGHAHAASNGSVDHERTVVTVGVDYATLVERAPGTASLHAGAPLTGEAARRLACDAGLVRVITRGRSEILDVGRKTRHWPTAIRRAIMFRHDNQCCFGGCSRRIVQIHHTRGWADGGRTGVDVGVPLCYGHHHLVHDLGWCVTYDARTGAVTFTPPCEARLAG